MQVNKQQQLSATIVTLNDLVYRIQNKIPFAFSRWGDGEWYNVYKSPGQNCDGNLYYHDLGDKLLEIVSQPCEYYLGIQTLAQFSVEQSKKFPQVWGDSDVLHKASMHGSLNTFIDCLYKSHVVYIGNASLKKLPFVDEFIEIPYNNVWLERDNVVEKIENTFDDSILKVYCLSSVMECNVFIDMLWKKNKNHIYLDVGSVFDPYVGKNSRSYHHAINKSQLQINI